MKIKQGPEEVRLRGKSAAEQRSIRAEELNSDKREASHTDGVPTSGMVRGNAVDVLPPGYGRNDEGIREEVLKVLREQTELAGNVVEVRVDNGQVLIRGSFSPELEQRAVSALRSIVGVTSVESRPDF